VKSVAQVVMIIALSLTSAVFWCLFWKICRFFYL